MGLLENSNHGLHDFEEEDEEEMIDLTSEELKTHIKMDNSLHMSDANEVSNAADIDLHDVLYPTVELNTGSESLNVDASNQWNSSNQFATVTQFKEGEFLNSSILSPKDTRHSKNSMDNHKRESPIKTEEETDELSASSKKRKLEASTLEMQNSILKLLNETNNQNHDSHDEDRMFLLSLVSDLKRVPMVKKMLVKAEIAMAIARALQP